uniref:Uncharacterized protein n=1 Tax=Eucampia antarctica TaxID=49252 RepID=A0A7S2W1D5_9STRA|mmetsp:Transcript_16651/g.16081  ORF Transcript_16651/g.16081 Transcript_16651/m.16081 type:complete len:357 (+) Transcript_16651:48-1118(+)|eukprot:CAMPEP_0197831470 /NCGR_PEP_ID=MMETSP1437-20131217/10207_1 /TAXON_ID=49252 ORGANISM="Eucampia antarctica, Strain CCMP1452" /NCGR_SAMPLE_ID=MMETSP1437 /ASSEMBLY_ACC=CAM_ASM_001096 /LENGTH=356 /DNA_ID=CAMNT_0043434393 /DNA_START=48 /DNA_END=1118 /DNA_ORIENTATION=+
MLVLKTKFFVGILAACGVLTSFTDAKTTSLSSRRVSSRRVIRKGQRTRRAKVATSDLKKQPRECFVTDETDDTKGSQVQISCSSKADTLWYTLEGGDSNAKVDLVVKKGKKKKGPSVPGKKEKGKNNSFSVRFMELIEYVPTDVSVPAYDWIVDPVQILPIKSFLDFTNVTKNNGVWETTLKTKDGVLTLVFHITEGAGQTFSQHQIKYDVIIENFPWKNKTDSLLALTTEVVTPSAKYKPKKTNKKQLVLDVEDDTDDPDNNGYSVFGEYSWVSNAVDNDEVTLDIVETEPADQEPKSKTQRMAFSFLKSSNATKITWDPEIGIGYSSGVVSLFTSATANQLMVGMLFSLACSLW